MARLAFMKFFKPLISVFKCITNFLVFCTLRKTQKCSSMLHFISCYEKGADVEVDIELIWSLIFLMSILGKELVCACEYSYFFWGWVLNISAENK